MRVIRPACRQIESSLDQRRGSAEAQGAEHAHLGIIDFPKPPIPLTRNASRHLPLLADPRFAEQKHAVGMPASVGIADAAVFSRLFTRHAGLPPVRYREREREPRTAADGARKARTFSGGTSPVTLCDGDRM